MGNRKEAERLRKEFDRTVDYLRDTIAEYKNLQREGSHINVVDGTWPKSAAAPRRGSVLGPFNYPLNETFCVLLPAF